MPKNDPHYDDMIQVKKIKQEGGSLEGDGPKAEPIVPKTFKEKWKNYWYHYKLQTFFAVCGVVLVSLLVYDQVTKIRYDHEMIISTKYRILSANEDMEGDLADYLNDVNGNGRVDVKANEVFMPMDMDVEVTDDADLQEALSNRQELYALLAAGESFLFVLDQDVYDFICSSNEGESPFVDLEAVLGESAFLDGDKLLLSDIPLGEHWKLYFVDEPIYLCVRQIGGTAKDTEENNARVNGAVEMVGTLVAEANEQ